MNDITAQSNSTDDNSVVTKEADTWLTNFIPDRTRQTYKKAIEEFVKLFWVPLIRFG